MIKIVILAVLIIWVGIFLVFARSAYRDSQRDKAERRARIATRDHDEPMLTQHAEAPVHAGTGRREEANDGDQI